ncbi:MFS transporter [Luteimonas sp. Y-2-2-4F]|nr:MFS transporter [Luteimonas sp. Y-2-2-4F]MCD9033101.1 MFS transporter [Luteimonas sp. Y-2-2-4F]
MSGAGAPCATAASAPERLPLAALLALAMAGFVTILTEALPAGLLLPMSAGLGVSEALVGQLVTVYALGSLAAAIPLTAATQSLRRRPLLLAAIVGFAATNTATALTDRYAVMLAARFLAGVSAGLLWSLAAGYAARMVPPHLKGRAIAVAMIGTPLALSLGIPAGTLLGAAVGWRSAFATMSVLAAALVVWVLAKVPDFPGRASGRRQGLAAVFRLPGVRPVLLATLGFVLAHNLLYTYIAPLAARAGLVARLDALLFAFGTAAVAGIWIVGVLVDRRLRALTLASTALFALAALALGLRGDAAPVVWAAVALWGLVFGGVATLFQTASAHAAGEAADVAQSMIVTVWNLAIAGGGLLGGALLESRWGVAALPWAALPLLAIALATAWSARRHGFPGPRPGANP